MTDSVKTEFRCITLIDGKVIKEVREQDSKFYKRYFGESDWQLTEGDSLIDAFVRRNDNEGILDIINNGQNKKSLICTVDIENND